MLESIWYRSFSIYFPRDSESFLCYFYSKEKNRKDQINQFHLNFLDSDNFVNVNLKKGLIEDFDI